MWRMWWAEALALSLLMFARCRIWLPYDPVGAVAAGEAVWAMVGNRREGYGCAHANQGDRLKHCVFLQASSSTRLVP
jgi:hypothetical protein